MIYIIIISIVLLILIILFLYFKSKNNIVKKINNKLEIGYQEIKKELDSKLDIVTRLINIMEKSSKKENKLFKKVKNIKSDKLNEYEIDSLLMEVSNIILDMNKSSFNTKVKSFDGLIKDLENSNMNLIALRTFYNKYVGVYNNLITKSSTKILSKIKGYETKKFFEGTELEEEVNF